jgi:hypothetical protein
MQYKLNSDFTALDETSGIFFAKDEYSVEIATGSSAPDAGEGFILKGGQPMYLSASTTIYARATGTHATLNVVEDIATS